MESVAALMLVLSSLPVGLAVNVYLSTGGRMDPGRADGFGFGAFVVTAALGTLLGWHSRQRVRARFHELQGLTTATLALVGGLTILLGSAVVMLKSLGGQR